MMTRRKFIAATALVGPLALAAEVTKSAQVKEVQSKTIRLQVMQFLILENFLF